MCDADVLGPLTGRLAGAEPLLVVPLTGSGPTAFLIVVAPGAADVRSARSAANRCGVEFALALELARLGREAALHRDIQELLLRFSRGISSTLSVAGALASLVDRNQRALRHRAIVGVAPRPARPRADLFRVVD